MRYGITVDDDEMSGNVSDCSDDSFEIISAESAEEPESVVASGYKPSVLFQEMFDVYPVDTDIVARISFVNGYEKSPEDNIVLLPVAWGTLEQGLCVAKIQGNFVKFDVKDLPKTSGDKFYQLCYSSKDKTVKGVSAPFSFREVHEDELMEFQKEQNQEFWTFRSRFAILMNTYWNSLVESKRTIDSEKNKVTLIDAGNDPFKNETSDEIIVRSDDEDRKTEQIECTTSPCVIVLSDDNDGKKPEQTECTPTPSVAPLDSSPICDVKSTESDESKAESQAKDSRVDVSPSKTPSNDNVDTGKPIDLSLLLGLQKFERKVADVSTPQNSPISVGNMEADTPLDLSSLVANVKLDCQAKHDNSSKSDDMKRELEEIEWKRRAKDRKYEKKKKELDAQIQNLSKIITQQRKKLVEQTSVSEELDCLKQENKKLETELLKQKKLVEQYLESEELDYLKHENEKLETELKKMKSIGNTSSAPQIRDLMCANNALQSELNQLKLREVSFLRQIKEYKDMKNSYQALEVELKNTQEFLEYMVEQKDERLQKMTSEERKGHLYVYDFMKNQFKKRSQGAVKAKVEQTPSTSGQNVLQAVEQQAGTSGQSHAVVESEPSPTVQGSNSGWEKLPECEEAHLIDQGYENDENRKEHIQLLRKLKAWFQDETLDGAEDIRNELRMQYVHMESCNRHLSSELLRLKKQYEELETQYVRARSDLIRTEGRLARKVNEKVSLSKLLEASREKINHLTLEGRSCEEKDLIIEGLRGEIESLKSQLGEVDRELSVEKISSRTLHELLDANKKDKEQLADQLNKMHTRTGKFLEECQVMESDYEARLKIGAKEYAKLQVKYQRLKDLFKNLTSNQTSAPGSPY